ncbi:MAG: FG-GAP-like repeat-containing protein [Actinomycetota bacterium]
MIDGDCALAHPPSRRGVRAVAGAALVSGLLGLPARVADASPPPVTFAGATELPVGTSPQSVALGDLNGDGALDVVVANRGWIAFGPGVIGSASVLLGDGNGGFGTLTDYALGNEVRNISLGDLDGDTFLDLIATASGGIGKVWVRLGDGAGGFGPQSETIAGSNLGSGSLAVADLNGDTFPDVAVADSESVNVLLGDGTGEFSGNPVWPVLENWDGTLPNAVVAAHLNGDAFLDLASANLEGTVSVLLGSGDGTFLPAIVLPAGTSPRSLITADLDDDGSADLISSSWTGGLSVRLGNGDGTFQASTDVSTGLGAQSVTAADIDGDTVLDLAAVSFDTDAVSVLVGDGAGAFAPPVDFPTGWGPNAVAAGDLDGDGLSDLVVANAANDVPIPELGDPDPGPGSVSVLRNTTGLPPAAPTIGVASAGPGQATVSWTPPAPNGGAPVTGYVVTPYIGYFPLASTTFASLATTQTVTGLTNGTAYRFRLRALNANGPGGYSKATNPVVPAIVVPGPPTIGAAVGGDGVATVSWTAPASTGGSPITAYVITPYIGYFPLASQTFSATSTSRLVTGLANGTTYRFRVRAVNAVGMGGYSKVTNPVTPTS